MRRYLEGRSPTQRGGWDSAVGRGFACGLVVLVFSAAAFGQVDPNAEWVTTAHGKGLSDSSIERLATDGILVTGETYKQVFEPYINRTLPIFVTSDSLLNAYHVLYEESVLRLEQANARKLADILRFVLVNLDSAAQNLQADPNLVTPAKTRATIIVGTALKLLDETFQVSDPSVMAIIDDEVAKIVAANTAMKPAWMGPWEEDLIEIDYTRYKVRGFYTRTETLTRYFRAVAWLQSIPFRVSHDVELVSILMLGGCITPDRFGDDQARCAEYQGYFSIYKDFIGSGDDWDLITAAGEVDEGLAFDLEAMREHLIAKAQVEGGPQINDQIRFAPDDPNMAAEPNFRIVSAYRIPDGVLFQRTTDRRKIERFFPNGLEICVILGSAFAPSRIDEPEKAKLLEIIEESKSLFSGSSLYFDYLNMVATLLEPPEPNAPAFMSNDPWQTKSCGAVLSGWAQLRHTWVLQAKTPVYPTTGIARGESKPPDALVEPVPQFYRRMANLASRTRCILAIGDALEADYTYLASLLRQIADALEQSESEQEAISALVAAIGNTMDLVAAWNYAMSVDGDTNAKVAELRRVAAGLDAGYVDPSIEWLVNGYDNISLDTLWSSLGLISRRLESIANKQLAGVDPNETEASFFTGYGKAIAAIMLQASATSSPKDNAPRIADVFCGVDDLLRITYMHAGIGRARAIYVLYPWADTEVLCKGAVLPYYEFVASERLTDDEWKTMLDGASPPSVPVWLAPIMTDEAPATPSNPGRR
jgi:hypothetical protein